MGRHESISERHLQAVVALLALGLITVSLVALLLPVERLMPSAQFFPEQVVEFRLYDSSRQRFVHVLWVALTAAVCIAVLFGPERIIHSAAVSRFIDRAKCFCEQHATTISVALIVVLVVWAFAARPRYNRVEPMVAGVVLLYMLMLWPRWTASISNFLLRPFVVFGVLIAYAAVLNVSGLLLNLEFGTVRFVRSNDYHFAAVLSGIEQLRASDFDTSLSRFNYGVIWKYLGAFVLNGVGATDFGSYVWLVQGYQLLFSAIFVVSAYLWSRGNGLFVLLTCVSVLPWVATLHPSVMAPNQSGLRMLPFALLPMLLVSLRVIEGSLLRALFAGAASGFLILWNAETGIAATVGLGFAVLLLAYVRGDGMAKLLMLTGSVVVSLAITLTVFLYIISGGTLNPIELVRSLSGVLATGYSGLPIYFDLLALVVALCATMTVLYACFLARSGGDARRAIECGALAVTIMVWFAYFMNRPHHWKLWTFVMLAMFLLEPIIRVEFWRDLRFNLKALMRKPAIVVVALLLIYIPLHANLTYLRLALDATTQPNISGIRLEPKIANYATEQSEFVRQLGERKVVYLSAAQFLLAMLTQRVNPMQPFDPFGQIRSLAHLRHFQSLILSAGPDCVLVEAAASPLLAVNKPRQDLFDRLRTMVAENYRLVGERSGWQVWQSPSGKSCLGNNS